MIQHSRSFFRKTPRPAPFHIAFPNPGFYLKKEKANRWKMYIGPFYCGLNARFKAIAGKKKLFISYDMTA